MQSVRLSVGRPLPLIFLLFSARLGRRYSNRVNIEGRDDASSMLLSRHGDHNRDDVERERERETSHASFRNPLMSNRERQIESLMGSVTFYIQLMREGGGGSRFTPFMLRPLHGLKMLCFCWSLISHRYLHLYINMRQEPKNMKLMLW